MTDNAKPPTEQLLQLVRAYRGEVVDTSAHTKSILREELSKAIGDGDDGNYPAKEGEIGAETPILSEEGVQPRLRQIVPLSADQLELRIRKIIQAGGSWHQLERTAWELLRTEPSPRMAAKILEFAALYGGLQEIPRIIEVLLNANLQFYQEVHPHVRTAVAVRLWGSRALVTIRRLLSELVDESKLTDIEKLFRFWDLAGRDNLLEAFEVYQIHFEGIERALKLFGASIAVSRDQLYLTLVKSAVQIRQDALAKRLAEEINPNSTEFAAAVEILGFLPSIARHTNRTDLSRELSRIEAWQERLKLVEDRCRELRGFGNHRNQRPRQTLVNDLIAFFADPLGFLPQAPEPWRVLTRIIAEQIEILPAVPTLLDAFFSGIDLFYTRACESALWEHRVVFDGNSAIVSDISDYLRGVSLMHRYFAHGPRAESLLWHAKELLAESQKSVMLRQRPSWDDLVRSVEDAISNSREHSAYERDQMLAQIRIVANIDRMTSPDIHRYLESEGRVSGCALNSICSIAAARDDDSLEIATLQQIAQTQYLSNAQLDRLFRLAAKQGDQDLAWRVATILHARKVLDPEVVGVWNFSGEGRQFYPVVVSDIALLKRCFADLPSQMRSLAYDYLGIIKIWGQIVHLMDPKNVKSDKIGRPPSIAEDNLERKLLQIGWLPVRSKILFHADQVVLDNLVVVPNFIEVLDRSDWNYVFLRIAEKGGAGAFGWEGERLRRIMNRLVDSNGELRVPAESGVRLEKLMNQLDVETKMALRGFCSAGLRMSPEELMTLVTLILARLALVTYPSHLQALRSVMAMRAPLGLLRSIEALLVSKSYGSFRRIVGIGSLVNLPSSIASLSTILMRDH